MQVALIPRLYGNMCQFVSTENSWHNICSTIDDKAILAPRQSREFSQSAIINL